MASINFKTFKNNEESEPIHKVKEKAATPFDYLTVVYNFQYDFVPVQMAKFIKYPFFSHPLRPSHTAFISLSGKPNVFNPKVFSIAVLSFALFPFLFPLFLLFPSLSLLFTPSPFPCHMTCHFPNILRWRPYTKCYHFIKPFPDYYN